MKSSCQSVIVVFQHTYCSKRTLNQQPRPSFLPQIVLLGPSYCNRSKTSTTFEEYASLTIHFRRTADRKNPWLWVVRPPFRHFVEGYFVPLLCAHYCSSQYARKTSSIREVMCLMTLYSSPLASILTHVLACSQARALQRKIAPLFSLFFCIVVIFLWKLHLIITPNKYCAEPVLGQGFKGK